MPTVIYNTHKVFRTLTVNDLYYLHSVFRKHAKKIKGKGKNLRENFLLMGEIIWLKKTFTAFKKQKIAAVNEIISIINDGPLPKVTFNENLKSTRKNYLTMVPFCTLINKCITDYLKTKTVINAGELVNYLWIVESTLNELELEMSSFIIEYKLYVPTDL